MFNSKSLITANTIDQDRRHADNKDKSKQFMLMKQKFTPDFILSKIDYAKLSNICQ